MQAPRRPGIPRTLGLRARGDDAFIIAGAGSFAGEHEYRNLMLESTQMNIVLIVSAALCWAAILFLGFLILGVMRSVELLRWEMQEWRAITPTRLGRSGLKPGKKAPDFTLPSVVGPEVSLSTLVGRKVFLVFVQTGCGPCHAVVPDLNKLHRKGQIQVLAINNAEPDAARKWTDEAAAEFPVLVQEAWKVSKRYQVMATPFGFVIDEKGVITSTGIVNNKQQIGFVLDGRRPGGSADHIEAETGATDAAESNGSESHSQPKEVAHA
jgi:methylamine dehydrogenase accessory protein MauD